jgi:hypothetical protein
MLLFSMFMITISSFASAQEEIDEAVPVTVLGFQSMDSDERVVATISIAIRVAASHREGWSTSDRDATLGQMMIAVDRDRINNEALSSIGRVLYPERRGQLIFGRISRLSEGSDEITIRLFLFDTTFGRVVRAMRVNASLSDLIIRGRIDQFADEWLSTLVLDTSVYEDDGEPYFVDAGSDSPVTSFSSVYEIAGATLLGVAGVSLITAIALGAASLDVSGDAQFAAYRSTWDASRVGDVCDVAASDTTPEGRHAASVCSEASLLEALVPVFWVIAGASAVAGVVLVWHPFVGGEETVALTPSLGPRHARIDLRLTF